VSQFRNLTSAVAFVANKRWPTRHVVIAFAQGAGVEATRVVNIVDRKKDDEHFAKPDGAQWQ
jgi:hypothetical protein